MSKVFAELGLGAAFIRSEVEKTQGRGPERWLPRRLPFTPRMKSVLGVARLEAKAQGQDLIGAEHLLIGLVREKEGLPASLFSRLGIGAEAIGNDLLAEMHVHDNGPRIAELSCWSGCRPRCLGGASLVRFTASGTIS